MALSLQSNWGTLENPILDMSTLNEHPSEVAVALAEFSVDSLDPSQHLIESLFDRPNQSAYTEPISFNHPWVPDTEVVPLPPDFQHPYDDIDFFRCRKRPRSCGDLYNAPDFIFEANSYLDAAPITAPVMNTSHGSLPELTTDFVVPSPVMAGFSGCNNEKKAGDNGCLSAQSVAARERRKKISEKTQELGRLVPGGNKMNTAEMFQAAYKYVKFLQAQVGILALLSSKQEYKGSSVMEAQMQVLLESPTMQEKFYGEERCIVPKMMVEALAEDEEIKSNVLISRELDRFMESMGG